MSHLSVRTLIEDTVKEIDDSIRFAYGRFSDFNADNIREDKRAHLDTLSGTADYTEESYNLTKVYDVGITFYKLDDPQGAAEKTKRILDETDIILNKFLQTLNLTTTNLDQDVTIRSIRFSPVIKVTVSHVTGQLLQFQFVVPDDFNYCLND